MRFDPNDSESVIPSIEIARFATALNYQGVKFEIGEEETISDIIMAQAIEDIKTIRNTLAGVRAIILFSYDEKHTLNFYIKNKFNRVNNTGSFLHMNKELIPMYASLEQFK